jgi:hypothetical protein
MTHSTEDVKAAVERVWLFAVALPAWKENPLPALDPKNYEVFASDLRILLAEVDRLTKERDEARSMLGLANTINRDLMKACEAKGFNNTLQALTDLQADLEAVATGGDDYMVRWAQEEARAEETEQRYGLSRKVIDACQQLAGKALGYPWFKDDPKNFPEATEADGVCIGEHADDTIVEELAKRYSELEAENARLREAAETLLAYRKRVIENLGEGVHAGLRKGSQAPSSVALWKAISDSRDGAWGDAVAFAKYGFEYGFEKDIARAEAALAKEATPDE